MKSKKRRVKSNKNGITLIALVITIIVLLILAGITINLTLGQDGIITKAQEAGKTYENAETKEQGQLGDLEASITAGKVARIENNMQYVGDGRGNLIPVPVGFSYLEGTKNTGFVIKNKTDNNEYVWVPVDDTTPYSYDRYAFLSNQPAEGKDDITNSIKIKYSLSSLEYFTEAMLSIGDRTELQSVTQYGGFYIGRYEVGVTNYSSLSTTADGTETWTGYSNGTAVVQKGKQVWNYITRDKAKEVAESMYATNDAVISRLCSSYAWDTALKFIEMNYPEYSTNSVQGNYKDTTFEYTELDGITKKTKEKNIAKLVPTGQTTAVNNIYDMGGNVWEWTTEKLINNAGAPFSRRGGEYSHYVDNRPAANRNNTFTADAESYMGFRIALFL